MSVYQTDAGVLKTSPVILTGTGATAIVTAGNDPAIVEYVRLTEVAGSTPTVILDIYDIATTTVLAKVRGTLALTAHGSQTDRDSIVLEPGQSLRATASAGNQVHVTATYTIPR
jgi:hypothetical protein